MNTCSGCDATWTAVNACHCGGCHCTLSGLGLFDAHRSAEGPHGTCLDPATLTTKGGKPAAVFRGAMWRGPALTPDQVAKMKAIWKDAA